MKKINIIVLLFIIFSISGCERKQQIVSEKMSDVEIEFVLLEATAADEVNLEKEEIEKRELGLIIQTQKVHIVGSNRGNAVHWLNGETTILSKGTESIAGASGIVVSNSDVYIAGYEIKYFEGKYIRTDAVYWLNGVKTELPAEFSNPRVSAITISGSDVYIVGRDGSEAVYWLNGVQIVLPKTGIRGRLPSAWASAIAISGSDVYIVGSDGEDAVYWLNEIKVVLPSSGAHPGATATGIVISESDVIIVGRDGLNAVYWKNGIQTVLYAGSISPTYSSGSADAVAISGSDIYITGWSDGDIVYWLNGVKSEPLLFESGDEYPPTIRPEAIAISDSDVLIVGVDGDNAVLWLNGNRIVLHNLSWATAIFATQ